MELNHRFTVPIGVEETWAHFNDIASVAECFPGAQVTEADESSFSGSVKVKLGPIALQYNGSGTFVEKDADAHRFVVDAKGKDKRGNGTAGAKVTVSMSDAGGSTDVSVETDLAITGKPAQFGRGVMQDVSDKLLGQFVACLEQRLAAPEPAPEEETPVGAAAAASVAASAPAAPGAPAAPPAAPPPPRPAPEPEALDLGSAVLPVLLRSYWKQAAVALVVLVVLRRLLRRR
ncbi:carbon monoxide dehydrogenase [Nocardioides eburneiflavus]|uniref:Carbon monoxide dehydrogenase n=1 Tax=Nocardioides eburneiflavus TaxID=2518372 RepID=A0A4Z1BSK5_9ACTN|nr:SRPBCC family protein [Nocardioides eburneiflavus]TGN64281.1 carbon monoxide dehydrogenase [Nocardioides eburneiflavus]